MNEQNAIVKFEQKYLVAFKQLSELKKEQDKLIEAEKNIKQELEKAMNEYNITSIKNEYITISRVNATESVSIDLKKLEAKEPDLYNELLNDYPKVSSKKASIRFTVK